MQEWAEKLLRCLRGMDYNALEKRQNDFCRRIGGRTERMMKKPFIGITCNYETDDAIGRVTHMGLPGQRWMFLAEHYTASVEKAGGIPLILPVCTEFETVKEMLDRVDGVLLTGGNDVDPQMYGARADAACGSIVPERDRQEIAIARYIMGQGDKPLFGICRGMQVIQVAAGGALYQDLEKEGGFKHHYMDMYPLNCPAHPVRLRENSRLAKIFGMQREIRVNSFHHQAVRQAAEGFEATAWSDDGVIEGMEKTGQAFVLGVQWHPEMMWDCGQQQELFSAFIRACRQ